MLQPNSDCRGCSHTITRLGEYTPPFEPCAIADCRISSIRTASGVEPGKLDDAVVIVRSKAPFWTRSRSLDEKSCNVGRAHDGGTARCNCAHPRETASGDAEDAALHF